MGPRSGCFLVAAPVLKDPNFARTVLYLLEHSDAGTMGLIINRPLDLSLSALWEDVPPAMADVRIAAEGGPVERTRGLLLHAVTDLPGAQSVAPGLAVGGDLDALVRRFADGPDRAGPRLFLGHSGWAPGQLDQELEQGAWIIRPGRVEALLTAPPEGLWEQLLESGGGIPEPSLN